MQRYDIMKRLGDGTYGSVWMGKHRKSEEVVAIKILKRKFSKWDECVALRELKSLQSLPTHPNVVKIQELIREDDSQLYFVFEYMPDGNLYQLMKQSIEIRKSHLMSSLKRNSNPNLSAAAVGGLLLTSEKIQFITMQVLKGLDHIHSQGYVHRDIKPENLLLKGNVCKIADFGLARKPRSRTNSPSLTEYISTRWYRAPEVLLRSTKYSAPIDIFAVGCVVCEMIELKPIFPGSSEIDQTHRVFSLLGQPTNYNWPEGVALFDQLKVKPSLFPASVHDANRGNGMGVNGFWTASGSNNNNEHEQCRMNIMRAVPNADPVTVSFLQRLLMMNPDDRPSAKIALDDPYFNFNANSHNQTNNFTTNNRKRKSPMESHAIMNYATNAATTTHAYAHTNANSNTQRNALLTRSTPCLEECQGCHHPGLVAEAAKKIPTQSNMGSSTLHMNHHHQFSTYTSAPLPLQPAPQMADVNEFDRLLYHGPQHFQIPITHFDHQYPSTNTAAAITKTTTCTGRKEGVMYQSITPASNFDINRSTNNNMSFGLGGHDHEHHHHNYDHHNYHQPPSVTQCYSSQHHNPFALCGTLGISGYSNSQNSYL